MIPCLCYSNTVFYCYTFPLRVSCTSSSVMLACDCLVPLDVMFKLINLSDGSDLYICSLSSHCGFLLLKNVLHKYRVELTTFNSFPHKTRMFSIGVAMATL